LWLKPCKLYTLSSTPIPPIKKKKTKANPEAMVSCPASLNPPLEAQKSNRLPSFFAVPWVLS
jgi:hypothetical protein